MSEEPTEDKRRKLEAASPAPSCLSMKSERSIELPWNFRIGNSPIMHRLKLEGVASPAPSCLSMKSDRSIELPWNLRNSPSVPSLLTEDDFRCSMCEDMLKDPVSIPCGHSYCRECITTYWAQPNHTGVYACLQCSHTYSSWPELYTSTALAEVIKKLQHFSPVPPAQSFAGAGDVCCDFCTGLKLRAVKSCLTCMASYCESHVRQHYTVPVLQRHTLVEPEHQEEKDKKQQDFMITTFKEDESQSPGYMFEREAKVQDRRDIVVDEKNCKCKMQYLNMFKTFMEQHAKVVDQQMRNLVAQQAKFMEQQEQQLKKLELQQTMQQQFQDQQMKTLQKMQQTMQQQFEVQHKMQQTMQQQFQEQQVKKQQELQQTMQQQFDQEQMKMIQKLQQTMQQQFEEQHKKQLTIQRKQVKAQLMREKLELQRTMQQELKLQQINKHQTMQSQHVKKELMMKQLKPRRQESISPWVVKRPSHVVHSCKQSLETGGSR